MTILHSIIVQLFRTFQHFTVYYLIDHFHGFIKIKLNCQKIINRNVAYACQYSGCHKCVFIEFARYYGIRTACGAWMEMFTITILAFLLHASLNKQNKKHQKKTNDGFYCFVYPQTKRFFAATVI